MSGAPDNPIGVGPQPGSVRPRRYLFGATLTLVALVTMLAVVVVYAGVPDRLLKQGDGHGSLTRTISVVVAAREIPRGQRIFPLMVRTSAIRGSPDLIGNPEGLVPAGTTWRPGCRNRRAELATVPFR